MSTRAQIYILNNESDLIFKPNKILSKEVLETVNIYIHSDGYPDYLLKWLCQFLNFRASHNRAFDSSYLMAWLVTYHNIKIMAKYLIDFSKEAKDLKEEFNLINAYEFQQNDFDKLTDYRGTGIYNTSSDWIDYYYIIVPNPEKQSVKLIDEMEATFKIFCFDSNLNLLFVTNEKEKDLKQYEKF